MPFNPLEINISNITNASSIIKTLGDIVLVSPKDVKGYQPKLPVDANGKPSTGQAPKGLLFHYEEQQVLTFEADITDHYVEDNTSLQDQVALKPEVFRTRGFIGELSDVLPELDGFDLQNLQKAANLLVSINGYFPSFSVTALNAYNQALLLYENAKSIYDNSISAFSSLTSNTGTQNTDTDVLLTPSEREAQKKADLNVQNKQQSMFQQLYGYWYQRTLFDIQTPWCIFTNMAILSVRAIQEGDTRMISDFEVTFKKIRTASTATSDSFKADRAQAQSAELQNNGVDSSVQDTPSTSLGGEISKVVPQ